MYCRSLAMVFSLLAVLGLTTFLPTAAAVETLIYGEGNDAITVPVGDYVIDGGGGTDILALPFFPDVYRFTVTDTNRYTAEYPGYTLDINNVERVRFGSVWQDKTELPIAAMVSGTVQAQLVKLTDVYLAYFGRAPDVIGLEYWQQQYLTGEQTFDEIIINFAYSAEAKALFPQDGSNKAFVAAVYQNCFNRAPDLPGWYYWTYILNGGDPEAVNWSTFDWAALEESDIAENGNGSTSLTERGKFIAQVLLGAYAQTSGPEDRALLMNKHAVALYYVNQLSLHPEEAFAAAINDLLGRVGMEYASRYNAEHVIDHVFSDTASLSDVMDNSTLLAFLWTHDPAYDADDDGDGWSEVQGDCNDSMTMIYPGANEVCGDGIDQDCNGVDQSCPEDIDDDGDGWSENQGDCNDKLAAIHPGAVETCGDGVDHNCDGADPFCEFPADPFDPQNYMPFEPGRAWTYRGSAAETGMQTIYYDNVLSVVGEKLVDGVNTTVFHETNPENLGAPGDFYLYKDAQGIRYYGSDPPDILTDQLAPYQEVPFPIKTGESFVQIDRSGLNFGADLDGDSVNETVDVHSQLTVAGYSTQTVPAGTFNNCAQLKVDVTMTIRLSRTNSRVNATGVINTWYAPGVGPVRMTDSLSMEGYSEFITEELTGYYSVLAADISPANSDSESPGKPSVGYDGSNYLVVSKREVSPSNSVIIGTFVNADGRLLKSFDIASADIASGELSNRLEVAFDGRNYLVVFGRGSQLVGMRVTQWGQVLDGPSGFVITDSGTNAFPVVAFDGTNYLVAWAKYLSDYDIYGALISPDGHVLDEFPVFTAAGEQAFPSIAFSGQNYLVAWRDSRWDGTASVEDIYATRVSPAGIPLDPDGILVCSADGTQGEPDLASDGSNYFAVWVDGRVAFSQPGQFPSFEIYGTRIDSNGSVLDGRGIPINTLGNMDSNDMFNPTVAFDGTDYFVSWQTGSYNIDPPAGIFGNWVTKSGVVDNSSGGENGLSISGSPASYAKFVYPVAGSGQGSVFLAWINLVEMTGESKDLFGKIVKK